MNEQQFIVLALMLVLAGISIWFGHKLTIESITEEKTERFKNKAFEKAKADYLEYFHRRFTGTAEKAAEAFNAALLRENEELKNQNEILKAELIKERKAHEDTRSS